MSETNHVRYDMIHTRHLTICIHIRMYTLQCTVCSVHIVFNVYMYNVNCVTFTSVKNTDILIYAYVDRQSYIHMYTSYTVPYTLYTVPYMVCTI